jgi:hypothetical protein
LRYQEAYAVEQAGSKRITWNSSNSNNIFLAETLRFFERKADAWKITEYSSIPTLQAAIWPHEPDAPHI